MASWEGIGATFGGYEAHREFICERFSGYFPIGGYWLPPVGNTSRMHSLQAGLQSGRGVGLRASVDKIGHVGKEFVLE